MIKRFFFALGFLFLSVSITRAQGHVIHDNNAQTRTVGSFHAIKVATGIHLYLEQSGEEAVAVSAATVEERDRIKTVVEDGILKIQYDYAYWGSWSSKAKNLKAYVSCKQLDGLTASSGALVEIEGSVKAENLVLQFSSGANFSGTVNVTNLKVGQSSGAQSTISGTANMLKADASSGAVLNGSGLEASQCEAKASSGGGMDINVLKELSASAHSGGFVKYGGTGVIREVSTGSGGNVSKR